MEQDRFRVVGTRLPGLPGTSSWTEGVPSGAAGTLAIASAYWDGTAIERARTLAGTLGIERLQVLLWVAGSTRTGWENARAAFGEGDDLDLRFVDSPEDGGIFHVKLYGLLDEDDRWIRAYVGSGNWTAAAHSTNLELGTVLTGPGAATAVLGDWFTSEFAAATPAGEIDWEQAIEIAPAKSEAADRKKTFAAAGLARPARSTPKAAPGKPA